jgi:hypothetical protein
MTDAQIKRLVEGFGKLNPDLAKKHPEPKK